ncbi:hypothetical protein FQR65_LT17401 [Abscondita terminalis]|nr:hypothetical protein FQR65_LT17401 [Abscondita terminalis]
MRIRNIVPETGPYFPQELKHASHNSSNGRHTVVVSKMNKSALSAEKDGYKTVMVTVINSLTAKFIAEKAGVDDFIAEAKPEDKMNYIKQEQLKVIDQLDEYCETISEDLTYEGFASFVHVNRLSQNTVTRQVGGDYVPIMERDMPAEDIGKLLVMLYRYAKNYIKIAFAGTPLQTPEEFTYLMVLFTYDKLPQSELIRKNIMEKASGNEVIKRLMRMGMIMEAERSGDKRSKPISISPIRAAKILIGYALPKNGDGWENCRVRGILIKQNASC